jgi:hypothetical protein
MEQEVDRASDTAAIVGKADVIEADLAHAVTHLPGSKRGWLAPAITAAVMVTLWVLNGSDWRAQTLTVLLPMAFVVVMTTYFQRGIGRAWAKQALSNIGGPTTFRFDDYGFTCESSLRQHRLAWAGLARSLETPQAFVVYTTPGTVLIVPKRAFADDEVVRVSALLRERILPVRVQKVGVFGRVSVQRTLLLWVILLVTFLSIWHFLDEGAPPSRDHAHRESAAESARPSEGGEASDVDSSP